MESGQLWQKKFECFGVNWVVVVFYKFGMFLDSEFPNGLTCMVFVGEVAEMGSIPVSVGASGSPFVRGLVPTNANDARSVVRIFGLVATVFLVRTLAQIADVVVERIAILVVDEFGQVAMFDQED